MILTVFNVIRTLLTVYNNAPLQAFKRPQTGVDNHSDHKV